MAFLTKPKRRGKKGKWYAEIRENGKTIQTFSGYETKKDLEIETLPILRKLKTGISLDKKMTLPFLYERWLNVKIRKSNRALNTVKKFEQYLTKIKLYLDLPMVEISPLIYQEALNKIGETVNRDFLSRMNKAIHNSIIMAQQEKIMITDFTRGAEFFSRKKEKNVDNKYIHSIEDYLKLLEVLKGSLNYQESVTPYYLYVLFQCGFRPGELLALTWKDVNFKDGTIRTRFRVNTASIEVVKAKTEGSIRTIPINEETQNVLKKLHREQNYVLKTLNSKNEGNYVFFHYGLKMGLPNGATARKLLAKIMNELNISPIITPYGARHTRVSYLHAMGIPDDVIARYMGHANLQEFYLTYHHLLEETRNRGFENIKGL